MQFGPDFAKPPRPSARLQKAENGSRMIEAKDIRKLLKDAGSPLDAMILLGISCGFGQGDCAELPPSALARRGWIDFRWPTAFRIGRRRHDCLSQQDPRRKRADPAGIGGPIASRRRRVGTVQKV
jgi:hypothetical protein